ncbi:cache domain-containing protein [Sciscionella sediminilitoris]|uniref:cache domain-containing protein n=1 Tax=Sciscionella sediminilitoris TaxID=1445613 RepID=UPI0004DF0C2C|nr:cache domain-containing protein [Sciscionella sp. SE31]
MKTLDRLLTDTADTIATRIDGVFTALHRLRRHVADVGERAAERRRPLDREGLSTVRPTIQGLLAREEPLIWGIGVAVEPDVLTDAPRWLDWWQRAPGGQSQFIRHELNPEVVGFYDYQAREWFRAPIGRGAPAATGPYLDAGGTDMYTVTLAIPLTLASGGDCVIGADLSMPALEVLLLHSIGTREHKVVLLAGNDRVIASNSARHVTGSRFRSGSRDTGAVPVRSIEPDRLPWRLITVG